MLDISPALAALLGTFVGGLIGILSSQLAEKSRHVGEIRRKRAADLRDAISRYVTHRLEFIDMNSREGPLIEVWGAAKYRDEIDKVRTLLTRAIYDTRLLLGRNTKKQAELSDLFEMVDDPVHNVFSWLRNVVECAAAAANEIENFR